MSEILLLVQQSPKISIVLVAIAISFFISLVNYLFLDKDRVRELKARQKEIQKQIKEHQKAGNHEKMLELQKEMMSAMPEMFKHSMKPMLITLIPILVLFAFVRNVFSETAIASTWFWWYLITALISSMIFRKIFKLP